MVVMEFFFLSFLFFVDYGLWSIFVHGGIVLRRKSILSLLGIWYFICVWCVVWAVSCWGVGVGVSMSVRLWCIHMI